MLVSYVPPPLSRPPNPLGARRAEPPPIVMQWSESGCAAGSKDSRLGPSPSRVRGPRNSRGSRDVASALGATVGRRAAVVAAGGATTRDAAAGRLDPAAQSSEQPAKRQQHEQPGRGPRRNLQPEVG